MSEAYTHNKRPKDPVLCKMIRKCITQNRKELGLSDEEVAHELGMNEGTLRNKLKPSYATGDFTLSELIHFLELTGDYRPLEYMVQLFGMLMVEKTHVSATCQNINELVDVANIENSDVFREFKQDFLDGELDDGEVNRILKELEQAERANAELRQALEALKQDEE